MHLGFALGLSAGLLFAQICNVVCLAVNCADEKNVVKETPNTSSHCHNSQAPASQDPAPQHKSHNCQTHDLTVLPATSDSPSTISAQSDWQAAASLPALQSFVFSPSPMTRVWLSALRSPPRLPQRAVLRI
jgi:hypothetical protein